MICAVQAGPGSALEPVLQPVDEAGPDLVEARFWAVVRAAGLDVPDGTPVESPAVEPAEVPVHPRPTTRVAVDRERPRVSRPLAAPTPTPVRWVDPDGDGRLSRQRSPPANARSRTPSWQFQRRSSNGRR